MLQPFFIFKPAFIERFIALNKIYFVSQSYKRGQRSADGFRKTSILLSDYDDPGLARGHLAAIKHDKYAAIINVTMPSHLAKLREITAPASPYMVYWNAVESAKKLNTQVKKDYRQNIVRFLAVNTRWHIGRDETIVSSLELEFGRFLIVIRRGAQMLRVPLEKIEEA